MEIELAFGDTCEESRPFGVVEAQFDVIGGERRVRAVLPDGGRTVC